MAFSLRNLSVLAYAGGFTLWLYKSGADDADGVAGDRFFDDAGDMLAGGDMVMVSARDGGRMLCVVTDGTGLHMARLH